MLPCVAAGSADAVLPAAAYSSRSCSRRHRRSSTTSFLANIPPIADSAPRPMAAAVELFIVESSSNNLAVEPPWPVAGDHPAGNGFALLDNAICVKTRRAAEGREGMADAPVSGRPPAPMTGGL